MERIQPLLITLLVVVSVGIVPGVAVADDEYPAVCSEAPFVEDGQFSDEFQRTGDTDKLAIRLQRGQYLRVTVTMPDEKAQKPTLGLPGNTNSDIEVRGLEGGGYEENVNSRGINLNSKKITFELWAKTDKYAEAGFCLSLAESEWETPYEWQISINRSDPDVTLFDVRQLENRVVELQNKLDERSKSSANTSSGNVTIQVTVTPANGQQSFVEGGEALIQAESDNADVSKMRVKYGSGTYQLNSQGKATIPLAETGTQEMTLIYGDTTKEVSIDVRSQGQNQQNQQNQQDATPSGTSAPGFGIVAALVALLSSAFLLQRHRQS